MRGVPDQALEAKARREQRLKQQYRTRYLQAIGAGLAQAAVAAGGPHADLKAGTRLATLGADLREILEEAAASLYLDALDYWRLATPPEFAATIATEDEMLMVASCRRAKPTPAGGIDDRIMLAVLQAGQQFPADAKGAYSWRNRSSEALAAACDSLLNDLAAFTDRMARHDATAPEFRVCDPILPV